MKEGSIKPFPVAVVSDGDKQVAAMLGSGLRSVSLISEVMNVGSEKGMRMLDNGEVAVVVKVPDGLVNAMIDNIPVSVEVWGGEEFPVESSIILGLARGISESLTAAQATVYTYYDTARPYFESNEEFYGSYEKFARDILADVLQRGRYIDSAESIYGYTAQLISVIVFITASFAAAFVSMYYSEQLSDGTISRIRLSGTGKVVITLSKLADLLIYNALLILPLFAALKIFGVFTGISALKLFLCSCVSSLVFFAVSQSTAVLFGSQKLTILVSFACMIFLLFIGGGIYPLYLMGDLFASFGGLTPHGVNLSMTVFALGGLFPVSAIVYAAISLFIVFLAGLKGGRRVWA